MAERSFMMNRPTSPAVNFINTVKYPGPTGLSTITCRPHGSKDGENGQSRPSDRSRAFEFRLSQHVTRIDDRWLSQQRNDLLDLFLLAAGKGSEIELAENMVEMGFPEQGAQPIKVFSVFVPPPFVDQIVNTGRNRTVLSTVFFRIRIVANLHDHFLAPKMISGKRHEFLDIVDKLVRKSVLGVRFY